MRPLDLYLDSTNELREITRAIGVSELGPRDAEARFAREASRLFPDRNGEHHLDAARLVHAMIHERIDTTPSKRSAGEEEEYRHDWEERLKSELLKITGDPSDYWVYNEVWARVAGSRWGSDVIFPSLLTSAIADFEVLISRLVQGLLKLRPEILRGSDRAYLFRELEQFSDINEIRMHVVQELVDALLRGGFEDWTAWFVRQGIVVEGVTKDPDASLIEAFQRRHLLVHNGGIVNRQYLSKTGASDAIVGRRLKVTGEYIQNTTDIFSAAALKITFAIVLKLHKSKNQASETENAMQKRSYDLLYSGRDQVVISFGEWAESRWNDDTNRLTSQVNLWLAHKRLEGLDSIRDEVDGWNTHSLSGTFRLAKLALLDELDPAYELAARLITTGELQVKSWRTWPVLEAVRLYEAELDATRLRLDPAGFASDHDIAEPVLDLE
jgi:hypothetical protein